MVALVLLDEVDVDTVGDAVAVDGGEHTVVVWGANFGGGTVTIELSPDDGTTWITLQDWSLTNVDFTANEARMIGALGQGLKLRAVLSGSAGASDVSAKIF